MMVPGYEFLGWVAADGCTPVGTCFQVEPGVLVTAYHVLVDVGAATAGSVVKVGSIGSSAGWDATVNQVDVVHDLAVLHAERSLPGSVSRMVDSDGVRDNEAVTTAGHPTVDDDGHRYELLATGGHWRGPMLREGVLWARLQMDAVMPGMSGAPVLRASDRAVVGVVSARYNSQDGWLAGAVWIARVEDLLPLLGEVTTPPAELGDRPTLRTEVLRIVGAEQRPKGILLGNEISDKIDRAARARFQILDTEEILALNWSYKSIALTTSGLRIYTRLWLILKRHNMPYEALPYHRFTWNFTILPGVGPPDNRRYWLYVDGKEVNTRVWVAERESEWWAKILTRISGVAPLERR